MMYKDALREVLNRVYRNTDDCEMRISKDCYKLIEEALKKQIPKKVENYTIDCHGYMIYDCECPSCKTEHKEMYPFAYCPHCGQALDWLEMEE